MCCVLQPTRNAPAFPVLRARARSPKDSTSCSSRRPALSEKDAVPLGPEIIHSVINPIDRLTGAIHIYGGDFFAAERSEWDSLTLDEHHSDGEQTRRMFERANARYEASLREHQ